MRDVWRASIPNSHIHLGPLPSHYGAHPVKIAVEDVSFWYGAKQALKIPAAQDAQLTTGDSTKSRLAILQGNRPAICLLRR
jgi:hypothetical protein